MIEFGDEVIDHSNQKSSKPPHHYGSYQFFEANKET
jgi:hypothetical protein